MVAVVVIVEVVVVVVVVEVAVKVHSISSRGAQRATQPSTGMRRRGVVGPSKPSRNTKIPIFRHLVL